MRNARLAYSKVSGIVVAHLHCPVNSDQQFAKFCKTQKMTHPENSLATKMSAVCNNFMLRSH